MHGRVAREAFERFCVLDQLAFRAAAIGHLPEFGHLFDGPVERDLQFGRHQLGHAVHVAVRHAEDAAHVADRRFGAHGPEGDDLGHAALAVLFHHVIDDLVPFTIRETDGDVRHGDQFRIQEAFEEQSVADGVDVRNPQGVGNHASQGGSPGHERDALLRGVTGDIGDDKKVTRITHLADDAQFVFEPGRQLGSNGIITRLHAVEGQLAQVGVQAVVAFGQGEVGELERAHFQFEINRLGDRDRVFQGARDVAEQLAHFVGVFKVERIVSKPQPLGVVQFLARLDADQHVLCGSVIAVEVMGIVCSD